LADGSFSLESLVHDPGADGPGAQPGVSS
jgi:hypothetical protein